MRLVRQWVLRAPTMLRCACFLGEKWARSTSTNAKSLIFMVGGRGIEPLTPSMSRKVLGFDLVCAVFSVVAVVPAFHMFSTVSCCLDLPRFAAIC